MPAVFPGQGSEINLDGHKIYDSNYPALSTRPDVEYRFSDPNYRKTGSDVYFGENAATAFFEVRKNVDGKSLYVGQVEVKNVLDLTDPVIWKQMNIDPQKLTAVAISTDEIQRAAVYQYTNQIANQAYKSGYTGIIYPSSQNPGSKAVVLFGGRYDPNAIKPILDIPLTKSGGE